MFGDSDSSCRCEHKVLSKLDFDYFWTEPETRLNRFDQIDARLSQIVVAGARLVLLGTQEGYTRGWVAADDGDLNRLWVLVTMEIDSALIPNLT